MGRKKRSSDVKGARDLEGRYANYFQVGYNAFEFIFDFGQVYDGGKKPKLHTRIVMTPESAKNLLGLIQEAIDNYEHNF